MISDKNIGAFLVKNPNEKVMVSHGSGKYTFHNVSFWECLIFTVENKFKKFIKVLRNKRNTSKQMRVPVMKRIMGQFYNSGDKAVDLNSITNPPKGMEVSWDVDKGYFYTRTAVGQTNNQGIKQSNLMPKEETNDAI